MPELIDREQAGKNICKYCASNAYCKEDDCMVYQGLRDTPTIQIESEPVRHGRWIFEKGDNKETVDGWVCTSCKYGFHTKVPYFEEFKYCPMCGTRMDATDTNVGGKGGADNG